MKILVVDDNSDDRTLLRLIVERHGHQAIEAADGRAGLRMAAEQRPELIISDALMPGMDGFQFLKALKEDETLRGIPFIFYSAVYKAEEDMALARSLGAETYIFKPKEPGVLWAEVAEVINRNQQARTIAPELAKESEEYLKRYSQVVAAKLEEKVIELQEALTRREAAEKEIRFLASTVSNVPDAICSISPDGTILFWNRGAEEMLGYRSGEIIGRPITLTILPEEAEEELGHCLDLLNQQGSFRNHESRRLAKDGRVVPVEITGVALRDASGQSSGYTSIMRDISERKQLEMQLRQAQKMEAIGTLAGGIAHDFNNILTAILGYGEIVYEGMAEESPLREEQAQVLKAGNRAKELVKQILTFSRRSEQRHQAVQIHLIVKEALKLMRASIPTSIEIRENIDPTCGLVLADPSQIHQILMNLCTNAYQAMREKGGVLGVNLVSRRLEPADLSGVAELPPGDYIHLEVSDTGCGIDPAVIEKIFDPYFTTKGKGEGTGLGLSVVHGIVKSCGGQILVASVPGRGSTFAVYLPRVEAVAGANSYAANENLPGGRERILVVDDELPIALVEQKILESLGYQVAVLNSSADTLKLFLANPAAFDLLLTDMTMPEMSGAELSEKILAARPQMPIIICTGFSEKIDPEKAHAMGIRGYLQKPLSKKDLAKAVRSALDTMPTHT